MTAEDQKWSFVVAANRLPVRRVREGDAAKWVPSPGGLVSAMRPVMSGNPNAVWAGWPGVPGLGAEPFDVDGFQCHPVSVSQGELQLFYEGFSNATLWPLFHDALVPPEYHRTWWDAYRTVNQRYADTVADLAAPGAAVWIHDYHLLLVPGLLRKVRPDLRIGFFLHIPFPARELYIRLPWRTEIIDGLLGADLIGLQTPLGADNFCRAVTRITGIKTTGKTIHHNGRTTQVGAFPIGIDTERIAGLVADPAVQARAVEIRQSLGSPATVLLGVDRLDYTKGIEVRLRAFRELLAERRLSVDDCVLVQIAEPSRSQVTGYAEVRREVEQLVGDVNGNFGVMGRPVVHYLHQSHPIEELVAMYLIADVMLVTPLRDGMNLVAKEYVACRPDNTGVLVLSEFTGAAQELRAAELINPHDIEGLKSAMEAAAHRPSAEAGAAMRTMRRLVRSNTAQRWAERFLARLEASP
ncbi:MAG: trehalose-6-phosphate synthase [bacterium]|nr:trehalose-6-phosphate synthase [bacterium]MDE0216516.1 trehalose-6-phosphate synthase [bacterium]